MRIATALFIAIILGITSQGSATVTANGSLTFSFGSPTPDTTYGQISSFAVGNSPGSYNFGSLSGTGGTVTNGYSTSTVSGITNSYTEGAGPSYSLTANAPSSGVMGIAEADILYYFQWGGGWNACGTTIPAFSIGYNFSGHVDSPGDIIGMGNQLEITYEPFLGYNQYGMKILGERVTVYSDYIIGASFPWFTQNDKDQNGNISGSGTRNFDSIILPDLAFWQVRVGLGGSAYDAYSETNSVPEPSVLLLLGSGLMAVAMRKRFEK